MISFIETSNNCRIKHLTAKEITQSFTLPKLYSSDYNPYKHYCWVIEGKRHFDLEIEFVTINIEYSTNCYKDYVLLYDFDRDISKRTLKKRFCGKKRNISYKLRNNALIEYKSNSNIGITDSNMVIIEYRLRDDLDGLPTITGVVIGGIIIGIFLFFLFGGIL